MGVSFSLVEVSTSFSAVLAKNEVATGLCSLKCEGVAVVVCAGGLMANTAGMMKRMSAKRVSYLSDGSRV